MAERARQRVREDPILKLFRVHLLNLGLLAYPFALDAGLFRIASHTSAPRPRAAPAAAARQVLVHAAHGEAAEAK